MKNKFIWGGVVVWCLILAAVPQDLRRTQDYLVFVTAFILVAKYLADKINPAVGIAYGYFSIMSAHLLIFPREFFRGFDDGTVAGFEALVTQGILTLTVIAVGLAYLSDLKPGITIIKRLAFINAVVMCGKWCLGMMPCFLLSNPAWDAAFVAIALPFFFESDWVEALWAIPIILACLISDSSSGIAGVGIAVSCFLGLRLFYKSKILGTTVVVTMALGFLLIGYALQGGIFLNGSGRYHVWELGWRYFWGEGNQELGQGIGTWQIYGPSLQIQELISQGVKEAHVSGFTWAHNEWLQVLFETGMIGFGIGAAVFAAAVWEARMRPAIATSLLTFGVLAFVQPLLRNHLTAVLGAYLIVVALRAPSAPEKEGSNDSCNH